MKTEISATLRGILADTCREIAEDKSRTSAADMKRMARDAAPVISVSAALSAGNALIAELKECSPSQGQMRPQNVAEAVAAYKHSPVVKAISVLTSWNHFGQNMRVERLAAIKEQTGKPVLRKEFMLEEYQVYQARAHGADAILLMANILDADELRRLCWGWTSSLKPIARRSWRNCRRRRKSSGSIHGTLRADGVRATSASRAF